MRCVTRPISQYVTSFRTTYYQRDGILQTMRDLIVVMSFA